MDKYFEHKAAAMSCDVTDKASTEELAAKVIEKFGQAHDMCGCVRFLLCERMSSFVTGVTIPVDGGFLTLSGV